MKKLQNELKSTLKTRSKVQGGALALSIVFSLTACGAESGATAADAVSVADSTVAAATSNVEPQVRSKIEQAGAPEIAVGVEAPSFELPGSDGKTHRLSDYLNNPAAEQTGQYVVLAFFPKAFTGG